MIKKYFKVNDNLADPKRGMENYMICVGSMITSTRSWFTT